MNIETVEKVEPVKSERVTSLSLERPRRNYWIATKAEDGKPSWVSAVDTAIRGDGRSSRRSEALEVETQDLRAVAAMLIAHADKLGIAEA